jgi:predicted PolB exonuclease-like 3'-5' exonuclease
MAGMKTFVFDIETIPSQLPGIRDEFRAAVTAPGQFKKPESIAAWMAENADAEAEAAWLKTSFDGGIGQCVAIGWAIGDGEAHCYHVPTLSQDDERHMLQDFFTTLEQAGHVQIVGHNIIGFDIPFLWKRAMVLGVKPPFNFPRDPKPWGERICDTMLLWDSQQRQGGSMDRICRLLGIPGKQGMTGADVWPAVQAGRIQDVADYCRGDVERTRAMHRRMTFAEAAPIRAAAPAPAVALPADIFS